jgi:hypothetical protein
MHLAIVRAGTLDDPNIIAPKMTVWTQEAPTWACFDPRTEQFATQPDAIK